MKEKGDLCILVGYSTQSKGYRVYNKRTRLIVESIHISFNEIKEMTMASIENNTSGPTPQRQMVSDYDYSGPIPPKQMTTHDHSSEPSSSTLVLNVSPPADTNAPSLQELDFLFSPLFEEYFTIGNQSVSNTSVREEAESSTHYVDISNMHTFYQRHRSETRWIKYHPLEQVRGNPSNPVQTKRQLVTDPEMCMFALTMSTAEPKNIKEAMADSAWIEAMTSDPPIPTSLGTPLATKPKLDADLSEKPVDQTNYHSMIGSLMYLTSSRPDIVQAVCYCARYQARPTEKHLKEVKRIFRYLKGTINIGLWYPKDSGFELTTFLDADHAGCLDTRKSTSGGIQFLGDKLVSWMSKKWQYAPASEYYNQNALIEFRETFHDKHLLNTSTNDGVASSFQQSLIHYHMFMLKLYQDYQDKDCQGRLLASFQGDAKYEHVDQDARSQDGKDDKDKTRKRFKDLGTKTKSKDNDKGS
ncbi:retrovirus-related pol polyprotein from transposon TNT 1-94 [Tanacetum coccineum]